MNKNQFYYTRKEKLPQVEGEEEKFKEFRDSFNINMIIRTMDYENGTLIVLNDFHEEMREVPGFHPKTRKPTGVFVKERNTYQSELLLTKEDGERLYKVLNVD